jgi:molybdate transport system ATP-binding protein
MEGIVAKFKLERKNFALDVQLELPYNGFTAIFGASGSGKTTLIRCIAGLERTSDGYFQIGKDVWQMGKHVWLEPYKRSLGYVFQEHRLFPHLTVQKNICFGVSNREVKNKNYWMHGVELLEIGHLLHRKPHQLSGGERQRASIARALALQPQILLMDEPLSALDSRRKWEIMPYLTRMHREFKIPVFYVTHSAEEVAQLATHLVVLEEGKVKAQGVLSDVLCQGHLPVKLGKDYGVVIDAEVTERVQAWNLAYLKFSGGGVWTWDRGHALHTLVRFRVYARDVSLALEYNPKSSIQNQLQGVVMDLVADEVIGLSLVHIKIGEVVFLARVSSRACSQLGVVQGMNVWVNIKTVILLSSEQEDY